MLDDDAVVVERVVLVALLKVLMREPTFGPQIYKLNYLCTHGRFLSEVVLSKFLWV